MKIIAAFFALTCLSLVFATDSTQAFQVYTADQLANGIGVRSSLGFMDTEAEEPSGLQMEFRTSNGAVGQGNASGLFGGYDEGNNWYGRQDSGGRSYGDRTSNYQNCSNKDSQVGMLNAFGSNSGGSYPCQRFR